MSILHRRNLGSERSPISTQVKPMTCIFVSNRIHMFFYTTKNGSFLHKNQSPAVEWILTPIAEDVISTDLGHSLNY